MLPPGSPATMRTRTELCESSGLLWRSTAATSARRSAYVGVQQQTLDGDACLLQLAGVEHVSLPDRGEQVGEPPALQLRERRPVAALRRRGFDGLRHGRSDPSGAA